MRVLLSRISPHRLVDQIVNRTADVSSELIKDRPEVISTIKLTECFFVRSAHLSTSPTHDERERLHGKIMYDNDTSCLHQGEVPAKRCSKK